MLSITLIFTGNHTIAVVNGPESRQTFEECFSDVFREINEVISDGCIFVEQEKVDVEFFLGGDYKVNISSKHKHWINKVEIFRTLCLLMFICKLFAIFCLQDMPFPY